MLQRGRKSGAALAVIPGGQSRLAAPGNLTESERSVWLATVNSRPADWFGSEHVPLLVNYCRHACRADVLSGQLGSFTEEDLQSEAGFRRYERLSKLARDESNAVNVLARAMRITHQALYRADKAATVVGSQAKSKPWRMP